MSIEDEEDAASKKHASSASHRPAGAVFAMTNVTAGNRIVVYRRAADGTLERIRSVRTRGLGIGVDTDTQGALRLSKDNRYLYGLLKFTEYEAKNIEPFVSNSPIWAWAYGSLGLRMLSNIIGVLEISIGLLIATRPFSPMASAIGAFDSIITYPDGHPEEII